MKRFRPTVRRIVHASPALQQAVHLIRKVQQNTRIQREQRFYEERAAALPQYATDAHVVFEEFHKRLSQRGIQWPPPENPLHTVFATPEGNWELHSIPDELRQFGSVSIFTPLHQGTGASYRKTVSKNFVNFLRDAHKKTPVSFVLSYLSGTHLDSWAIEEAKAMGIPVICFHLDDRLYFRGRMHEGQWSGPAPLVRYYDLNLTNCPRSLCKYAGEGGLALFWPEGANPTVHHPVAGRESIDVAFIGARYGERPAFIQRLRNSGIDVQCFGPGWENGKVSVDRMVQIFSTARITLGTGRVADSDDQCLKGRDFEVPMCGGLYLTSYNDDLPLVYRLGEEIETYRDVEECIGKIKGLHANSEYATAIRKRGLDAALTRHRWKHRIEFLLKGKAASFLVPGDCVS